MTHVLHMQAQFLWNDPFKISNNPQIQIKGLKMTPKMELEETRYCETIIVREGCIFMHFAQRKMYQFKTVLI